MHGVISSRDSGQQGTHPAYAGISRATVTYKYGTYQSETTQRPIFGTLEKMATRRDTIPLERHAERVNREGYVGRIDMTLWGQISNTFGKRRAYPIPSHNPSGKSPFFPHLLCDSSESFIARRTVLPLHSNFKHFDCD